MLAAQGGHPSPVMTTAQGENPRLAMATQGGRPHPETAERSGRGVNPPPARPPMTEWGVGEEEGRHCPRTGPPRQRQPV